jgi:hypothetical protein
MTVHIYINMVAKRTETIALLNSGAMENFINSQDVKCLNLPTKQLNRPHAVYNVNETANCQGKITHYVGLEVWTGQKQTNMHFFINNLGETKAILRYP